ncbi:MAG: Fic family protein [Bacillota bacterium]|nr:Fic family protein [Bacillota bacterium]
MPYKSLAKLFHKDPEHYEEIYQSRFHHENARHLDFAIGDAPAFFLESSELIYRLLAIERTDKEILKIAALLPDAALAQFQKRCLLDEMFLSNKMEGVHSSRRELLENLESPVRRNRFYGLVQKYVLLSQKESIPLESCQDVRRLYDELLWTEIEYEDPKDLPDGEIFRKESVSVSSEVQKEIHRGLYPEAAIREAMKKALFILNDERIEILFRIAIFHYLFGYIHPFYNGNGRMSRFISSYFLSREFSPLLAYRLSFTIKESKSTYEKAFKTCNDPRNRGDLSPFLHTFLGFVEKAASQLLEALESRLEKLRYYKKILPLLPLYQEKQMDELYAYLLQASLFTDFGISTKDLLQLLEISHSTLKKRLAPIIDSGLIELHTEGRANYYQLNLQRLDELFPPGKKPLL